MNPVLKSIIEMAINYTKSIEARDAALDEIFTKLIVRPIQLAWIRKNAYRRSKWRRLL
jgi:hypothetical protein